MNEILEELKKENKAPTINNVREKLGLERIEQNTKTNEEINYLIDNAEFDKKPLLNYITNLQEENEFLKLNNPEMNIEHFRIVKENKRKIDNLRKENQKLVNVIEEINKYMKKYAKTSVDDKKTIIEFYKQLENILNKLTELKGGSDEK